MKISQDVRDYAAAIAVNQLVVSEITASPETEMAKKAQQFRLSGSELYHSADAILKEPEA